MKKKRRLLAASLVFAMLASYLVPIGQAEAKETYQEPLVHYDMTLEDGKLKDVSGNGYSAELSGLSEKDFVTDADGGSALKFNGSGYVKIPDCIGDHSGAMTIEMTYKIGSKNNEGLFVLGTKNASTEGVSYLRFHPNVDNGSTVMWESEVNGKNGKAKSNAAYNAEKYTTVTAVIQDSTLTYYVGGRRSGSYDMQGVTVQDILNTCANRSDAIGFLGRPAWANHDPYFSGTLKDFAIYNYAVPEEEILWNTRDTEGPIADYSMEFTEDGKLKDVTGHGLDAEVVNLGASNLVKDGEDEVLDFAGTNGYVKLPGKLVQGEEMTIAAKFKAKEGENSGIWTLGTKGGMSSYIRLHPSTSNGIFFEMKDEKGAAGLGNDGSIRLDHNVYNTVTVVFTADGKAALYVNGEAKGEVSGKNLKDVLSQGVADMNDVIGYIGKPAWDGDPMFNGRLAGFTVYERALTAGEIYMQSQEFETAASRTKIVSNVLPSEVAWNDSDMEWREGMVTGNGQNGVVNAGYPYSDTLIYQNIYLLMPSTSSRENPDYYDQLEVNRESVMTQKNNIPQIGRGFFYAYHPGPKLRMDMDSSIRDGGQYTNYERWTDFETAEVGVNYTNSEGQWERRTFTSREDDVTITEIKKSSTGTKVNMELSLDNVSSYPRFYGDPTNMQYKKIVSDDASYIALIGKYPGNGDYSKGELKNGGYAGTAQVVVVGGKKEKILNTTTARDSQNVGAETDPRIKITDADAVYIIERTDRDFDMCTFDEFKDKQQYDLLDEQNACVKKVIDKYTTADGFDYEAALKPHAKAHGEQFNEVKFSLNAKSEDIKSPTQELIKKQKSMAELNNALVERAYNAGRYVELCCSGYSAPRLSGMWTGEFNGGWRYIYTLDANVNLQISPMNTGHFKDAPVGFITFVLRQLDDWMENAYNNYRMHDAIQPSINTDGNSAIGIESDWQYPFQYWNAGASWLLLPIYEYWQCYGNQQIPISDKVDLYKVKGALGVEDGGLTDAEVDKLMERGYLDLEKDILLPLLTKQANFWEQLLTPEYYMDADGDPHYEKGKTELDVEAGERYMIIPTYSPENGTRADDGYVWNAATTMNATMDISAARDGLKMTMDLERAVGRKGSEKAIEKWSKLQSLLPDYQYDGEPGVETQYGGGGALKEWATPIYLEENRHRHISHMYVAWPAYETQHDEDLAAAAAQAIANRNRLNSGGEKTTGHGWMHFALVEARLKDGAGVYDSLNQILRSDIYYSSMVTDHNTNRGSGTYCTDTSIGMTGVINESLVFSNTGEIELLPSLPAQWKKGSMDGLMARTRAEIESMSWDQTAGTVDAKIRFDIDQTLSISCGQEWGNVVIEGNSGARVKCGREIIMDVKAGDEVTLHFSKEKGTDSKDYVDRADLQAEIYGCKGLSKDFYTAESFEKLEKSLAEAKEVLNNGKASQAEVDKAKDNLQAAKKELKEKKLEKTDVLAKFTFDDEENGFTNGYGKAYGQYELKDHGDGKAVYLDGTYDYLKVKAEDGTSLLTGVKEMTISLQVKPETGSSAGWMYYIAPDKTPQVANYEEYAGLFVTGGKLTSERYKNSGKRSDSLQAAIGSDWVNISVVYTEKDTAIYVDGVEKTRVNSSTALTDIFGEDSIFYIGKANWGPGEYYKGLIDNVVIESRALSAEEIAERLNGEEPPTPGKVDKTELEKAIKDRIPESDKEKYTEDSWKAYEKALKDAENVNADTDAAQAAVDAAVKALADAQAALEPKTDPAKKLPYVDVKEDDWFYEGVYYNYFAETMTGKDKTHFAPLENLARAQFAVIIHRMQGEPEMKYTAKFPDVEDEIWYTDAILWAAEKKIVNGYSDTGLFGPADNINREQMAVMMYRYAESMGYDVTEKADISKFGDAASVNEFAEDAMKWAVANGIINGKYEGTKIDPQGNALRGECALIIQRFMEKYE